MPEERLEFADHDQVRTLFGDRDRYLRLIRDELGIDVVLRDGVIRIFGDEAQVKRGREVFQSLAAVLRRTRHVRETDVWEALGTRPDRSANGEPAAPAAAPASAAPAASASASASASKETASRPADPTTTDGYGERMVDLFERGRRVRPKTAGQDAYLGAIEQNDLVLCVGPAGCGKTYLAVAAAINALRREQVRKIVLVRPAVEAGEKLGFLPGDMFAKVNPYLRPLLDALNDMLDFEQVQRYMSRDMIEIVPLAFMRGRTLNDTFIILDEGQNTTVTQMKMFLTRMGAGSRIVVTGDVTQLDLPENVGSGLTDAVERLAGIDGVAVAKLGRADIVRHRLVREIVHAYDRDASPPTAAASKRSAR
jgi:phosphate starvation-inducible PhoH-like protein